MIPVARLRADRRAFSAFYGAFAVLLAATVVFGALAAHVPSAGPATDSHDDRVADHFLAALLASTEPATNKSLGQALARLCLEAPCPGAPTPEALMDWAGGLAHNLSVPLGARFLLVLSPPGIADLSRGPLEPAPGLPMSRAETFHPGLGAFVGLALFLDVP